MFLAKDDLKAPKIMEAPKSFKALKGEKNVKMSCTIRGDPTPEVTW